MTVVPRPLATRFYEVRHLFRAANCCAVRASVVGTCAKAMPAPTRIVCRRFSEASPITAPAFND
jgi:hypothetical protein